MGLVVPLLAALYPILSGVRVPARKAMSDYGLSSTHFGQGFLDRLLERVRVFADELEIPIHIHLHETQDEILQGLRDHGKRPMQRLQDLGLPQQRVVWGYWLFCALLGALTFVVSSRLYKAIAIVVLLVVRYRHRLPALPTALGVYVATPVDSSTATTPVPGGITIEMLEASDIAVIVRRPDGGALDCRARQQTLVTEQAGPAGWNAAILQLIDQFTQATPSARQHGVSD